MCANTGSSKVSASCLCPEEASMCPHESGSCSQDGALTVGLQVQRQGCHGDPWGHPRATACSVGQLLFWRSLFLLRGRGLQMLHEFSSPLPARASRISTLRFVGFGTAPDSLEAPQAKSPASVPLCILELPARPRREGRPGISHLPLTAWLCLAGLFGHRARCPF